MKFEIQLNSGLNNVVESSTLAINQRVAGLRKEGREVYHFGFGESPFPVPPTLEKALKDNAHQKSYLPTQGLLELREKLAQFYHHEFNYNFLAENILVGPGSKELLFDILYLLDGPLLLPAPSWVSYAPQARLCDKEVVVVPASFENRYQVTADDLAAACESAGHGQKILILNFPNNPTGQCMDAAVAEELAVVCRKYNVIVISDEIYTLTQHDGKPLASLTHSYPEGTIVTGGLSKAFSAGGYRFGVALLPETLFSLRGAMVKMISETYSCVSAPIQFAALEAYKNFDAMREHVRDCTSVHALAGNYLYKRFVSMGLRCLKPQGGFYLFPDFSAWASKLKKMGINNDKDLSFYLLSNYSIATLPGSDFNSDDQLFALRIATVDYSGDKVLEAFRSGINDPEKLFAHMSKGCDQLGIFVEELKKA
ncbi:MAG: pyridoxal phosphate-dependent aminotransferase [bacterium]